MSIASRRWPGSAPRTALLAISGLYVATVYLIVVDLGTRVAPNDTGGLALTLVAAALVTVTLTPLRDRVRRRMHRSTEDRLLELTLGQGDRGDLGSRLEELTRLVAETFGPSATAEITASLGEELTATWRWPRTAAPGGTPPQPVRIVILRDGRELGWLTVNPGPERAPTSLERRLLDDAASHAGLLVETAWMDQTLQQVVHDCTVRNRELQESRGRIVSTMQAEGRRVERDIHDGAQQHLVALAVNLRLLRVLVARDPARARATAERLHDAVETSVGTLEALSRGLYPAGLAEEGLAPALRLVVASSPVPVVFTSTVTQRWSPAVEQAAYFACLEALQNAVKHAAASRIVLTLTANDDELLFEVADDGCGFDPERVHPGSGSANIVDRLSAVGGQVSVTTAPGRGTIVTGRLPARQTSAARASVRLGD